MDDIIYTLAEYKYNAIIHSVYDGDGVFHATLIIKNDIGMNIIETSEIPKRVRLYGVDTPEVRGDNRKAGIIVRNYVRSLLLNKAVIIETKRDSTGKYGRLLADIYIGEKSLSDILLEKGYAKPYFGGKKEEWSMEEIDHIIFNKWDTPLEKKEII